MKIKPLSSLHWHHSEFTTLQCLHVTGEGLYVLPEVLCKKHSLNSGCMQEMLKFLGALSTAPAVNSALSYSSSDGGDPFLLQRKKWVQLSFIFISALGAPGTSDIRPGRKGNNLCQVNAQFPLFSNLEQGKIKVSLVIHLNWNLVPCQVKFRA